MNPENNPTDPGVGSELSVPTRTFIAILLISIIGFGLIVVQTRFGPGTGGDSTSYLMGAENIWAGNGFSRYSGGFEIRPITGFPPFYSFILALVHAPGITLNAAARWINALLFGLNLLLAGTLVWRRSGSMILALSTAMILLFTRELLYWHSWVMSEPLFIFLMLLGMWLLLWKVPKDGCRQALLVGVIFALATLTRYIGIALFASAAFIYLFVDRKSWWISIKKVAVLLLPGVLLVGAWALRNAVQANTVVNRELIYHGIDWDLARLYLAEISSWFIPHEFPLPTLIRAFIAVCLAGLLLALFVRELRAKKAINLGDLKVESAAEQVGRLPWMLLTFLVFYGAILALNSLVLDASTSPPAVPRYLAPAFVALVIYAMGEIGVALKRTSKKVYPLLFGIYVAAMLIFKLINSAGLLANPLPNLGYTGDRIQWSSLVAELDEIDTERPILSNNPELVYILTGRPAYVRPIRYDHYQEQFRDDFQDQLAAARDKLAQGGLMVIFKPVEPLDLEVADFTGAVVLMDFEQAVIYGLPQARSPAHIEAIAAWELW